MKEDFASAKAPLKNPLFPLAKTILAETPVQKGGEEGEHLKMQVASAYLRYKGELARIDVRQNLATLKGTIAGRIGQILEHVTSAVGFDYRTNIALGFCCEGGGGVHPGNRLFSR